MFNCDISPNILLLENFSDGTSPEGHDFQQEKINDNQEDTPEQVNGEASDESEIDSTQFYTNDEELIHSLHQALNEEKKNMTMEEIKKYGSLIRNVIIATKENKLSFRKICVPLPKEIEYIVILNKRIEEIRSQKYDSKTSIFFTLEYHNNKRQTSQHFVEQG